MKEDVSHDISVSVVICCSRYERLDWLVEAVDSVKKQSKQPKEIIVVFDKTEGLEDALRRLLSPAVLLIPNKSAHGLSLARNTGIEAATGDIIAFLDDDAVAELDWLEHLVGPFSDPWVVGVGGKAVPDWLSHHRPFWFPEEIDWVVSCMYSGYQNDKSMVRNVFGCNMSFKKSDLTEINGFDSRLGGPISGDDTDICLRITQGNERRHIIYEPSAIIHHKISLERQSLRYVTYSAWKQGVGKAVTKAIHKRDARVLSSEKNYLRLLVLKFIPKQMSQVFKHPYRACGNMVTVGVVMTSIGLGYVLTRLKINRVRRYGNARI